MLTSVKNQTNLPRYFARVFDVVQALENWQLHLALDDGRIFRVEGRHPGPVAAIEVHNPDFSQARSARAIWAFWKPTWTAGGRRRTCRLSRGSTNLVLCRGSDPCRMCR